MAKPRCTTGPAAPAFLFPATPRNFPGQRWVKIGLRGLHVLCAGVYMGTLVFAVDDDVRQPWFLAALLSGILLLSIDLFETAAFLLQLRGIVVLLKLVLLAVTPYLGPAAVWVLGAAVIGSVISSHAPSSFRYFLVWGRGRIQGATTKG